MQDKAYSTNEIIVLATQIGVQAGIDYIREEVKNRKFNRHDRRLRNTKLLLKEYRKLFIHSKDAVCSNKKLTAVDILDELDTFENNDDLYIESIKTSKERTKIIIEHIKKMMGIFKYMAYKSKRSEDQRRYEIIFNMYISGKESTPEELSAKYNVEQRTIYRDIDNAIETLTALVFGIDGLKII